MEKPVHPLTQNRPITPEGKNHPDKGGKEVIGYDYFKEPEKPGKKIYYFADGTELIESDSGQTLAKWK